MIWKQFTHLGNFPPELKARFNSFLTTEFDDSLSVEMQFRSIIKWCQDNFKTVDTLIDFINDISNWLKQFENNFDTKLEDSVISVLSEWQASGQLDVVISEALQWQLDDYIATNEQDKLSLTAQLQQIENEGVLVGDQTKTKFGYFSINKERQTIDYHGFEDWGLLNATDLDRGYCSFDAKPILTSANRQSHLVGYQSRAIYSGSGGLKDYMNAYDTDMIHNGTGEINRVRQIFIKDIGGNGPVKDNFGLYIAPISRGSNINWGIYSENDRNMLMGVHTLAIKAITKDLAITYGSDIPNKNITFGYQAEAVNTGEYKFYNGITTLLASLNNAWLKLSRQVIVGSFTYAQLPPSEKGGIAYCTNGRKTGEASGSGTGALVYYDGVWKSIETHQLVTI